MEIVVFWFNFHGSKFICVQLTLSEHWLRRLALSIRQAVMCTNVGLICWCVYAPLVLYNVMHVLWMKLCIGITFTFSALAMIYSDNEHSNHRLICIRQPALYSVRLNRNPGPYLLWNWFDIVTADVINILFIKIIVVFDDNNQALAFHESVITLWASPMFTTCSLGIRLWFSGVRTLALQMFRTLIVPLSYY